MTVEHDRTPWMGWRLIDQTYLAGLPLASDAALRSYLEGSDPGWQHVGSKVIRRLAIFNRLEKLLADARAGGLPSLIALMGPSGEGKSTLLLQAARAMAETGTFRVLYRAQPGTPLQSTRLLQADGPPWLLVADEAHDLAWGLLELGKRQQDEPRGIHALVAVHSVAAQIGGWTKPWHRTWAYEPLEVRGLQPGDADVVVDAWLGAGTNPPGASRASLIERLSSQSKDLIIRGEPGSLLGGALKAITGKALDDHVLTFLEAIQAVQVTKKLSLLDCYVPVAALHALHVPCLRAEWLRDGLKLDDSALEQGVLAKLEGEVTRQSPPDIVLTRHAAVARVATRLAVEKLHADLAHLLATVVDIGVTRTSGKWSRDPCFTRLGYLSHRFVEHDELGLDEETRRQVARVTAEAVETALPENAYFAASVCWVYRETDSPDLAADFAEKALARLTRTPGREIGALRGLLVDWAAAEGSRGNVATNVWLAAIALSDALNTWEELVPKTAGQALNALGRGLQLLPAQDDPLVVGQGLQATAFMGRHLPFRSRDEHDDLDERAARALGAGDPPSDLKQAAKWLADAIALAGTLRSSERVLPSVLPQAAPLKMNQLPSLLRGPRHKSHRRRRS